MSASFDTHYWENRYRQNHPTPVRKPNPHLVEGTARAPGGHALDAGAGEGADALWLASRGWRVTAVDVSATALDRARAHAETTDPDRASAISWLEADLTRWTPEAEAYDLVFSAYVHTTTSPEAFYRRLAAAVAPGGTLLIVGHHHSDPHTQHAQVPSAAVHTTAEEVAAVLAADRWDVAVAETRSRAVGEHSGHGGHGRTIHDTVLRARRHH